MTELKCRVEKFWILHTSRAKVSPCTGKTCLFCFAHQYLDDKHGQIKSEQANSINRGCQQADVKEMKQNFIQVHYHHCDPQTFLMDVRRQGHISQQSNEKLCTDENCFWVCQDVLYTTLSNRQSFSQQPAYIINSRINRKILCFTPRQIRDQTTVLEVTEHQTAEFGESQLCCFAL